MRAVRSLAVLSIAVAMGIACAEPPPVRPPPLPPGMFEGQSPPAAEGGWRAAVTQRPENPGQGSRRPATDVLFTTNPSAATVWVTVYRDGGVHAAGCMRPGRSKSWPLGSAAGRWTVRAEVSRNADCLPPRDCDTTIELQPGMSALELADASTRCHWVARVPARVADPARIAGTAPASCLYYRKSSSYLVVTNSDASSSIWVTLYRNAPDYARPLANVRQMHETICIEPGETRNLCVPQSVREGSDYRYRYWIRAERVRKGGCNQPVTCDTTIDLDWKLATKPPAREIKPHLSLASSGQACRWQLAPME